MNNKVKDTYLHDAFPFWGTSLIDNIDIDFYDVDQLDNFDYPGMSMINFVGLNVWKMICNLKMKKNFIKIKI